MIIIKPAAILSSYEKNNNIFPKKEAAIPRVMNTDENPKEKIIVLIKTSLLSFSISFNFLFVI